MDSMVNINYEIPADLHRRLKYLALDHETTLKDLIIKLLSEGVDRETAEKEKQ